jgi:trk system potassium uptake protein TrkA
MIAILVGCGRVGSELAFALYRRGHQVAVIDHVGASFDHLHPEYRGRTIEANVLAEGVLQKAGVEEADALCAVTNSDAVNAVVGRIATTVYRVPKVVVRNYDPRYLPIHEAFGLQVVSSTAWGAQRIEDLLHGSTGRTLLSTGGGEVEVEALPVPDAWEGRSLAEVLPKEGCLPVALTRAGRALLPSPDTRLARGDLLHLSLTPAARATLRRSSGGKEA